VESGRVGIFPCGDSRSHFSSSVSREWKRDPREKLFNEVDPVKSAETIGGRVTENASHLCPDHGCPEQFRVEMEVTLRVRTLLIFRAESSYFPNY
jgi:hypothetical protein